MKILSSVCSLLTFGFCGVTHASDLKIGDAAPLFHIQTETGADFDLASRRGHWTVLYFYPKAGTPGCTNQACAFRDNLKKIQSQGAEVFGISADSVADQAAFHAKHKLTFTLLADPDDKVIALYGSKMPILKFAKRWTFIVDPSLKIRAIEKDVDPALDADRVAHTLAELKKN